MRRREGKDVGRKCDLKVLKRRKERKDVGRKFTED